MQDISVEAMTKGKKVRRGARARHRPGPARAAQAGRRRRLWLRAERRGG
jgi:hypothetical protein